MQNISRFKSKRGFTITEVAIVFAIVGSVIGAIWVAASAVYYHVNLNRSVDEINQIVGNMRSLYAGQNAAAANPINFGQTAEANFISQGIFPKEMLRASNNAVADHPFDQSAQYGSAEISVSTPTVGRFVVEFQNLPMDACADLLIKNSVPGAETGLVQIKIGGTTCTQGGACSLPVSPIQAATLCPAGALYTIDWQYTLGS